MNKLLFNLKFVKPLKFFILTGFSITYLMIFLIPNPSISDSLSLNERDVQIGTIKNISSSSYSYIEEYIKSNLIDGIKKLPYITITDEERKALANKIGIPETEISKRLNPRIISKQNESSFLPLYISGEYRVDQKTESVWLKLTLKNMATGIQKILIEKQVSLEELISNPSETLNSAIKNIVRYNIYTLNIKVNPENSELFVDRSFAGRGRVSNYFILPGYHTISAKLDGYKEYSEVIYINKDNLELEIYLNPLHSRKNISIYSKPGNTDMYLGEKLVGKTPLAVQVGGENEKLLLLKKEGYRTKVYMVDKKFLKAQTIEEIRFSTNLLKNENIPDFINNVELHKRKARIYSYFGIGFMGASIIFGSQQTIQQQKADIYRNISSSMFNEAEKNANLFKYLTWGTIGLTVGTFTKSFLETLKYFKGYKSLSEVKTLSETFTP